MTATGRPGFHLAIPVDDLDQARTFYGGVLGLPEGRSSSTWVDWNFSGHQLMTHVVGTHRRDKAASNPVDGHDVPVPHFGLLLSVEAFHELADRLRGRRRGVRDRAVPAVRG